MDGRYSEGFTRAKSEEKADAVIREKNARM
jgi:hypothetical protein